MKKLIVTCILCLLSTVTIASQGPGMKDCMGGNCGNCAQNTVPSDPWRRFQADTLGLRQEMMNKRFELQRENLKAVPDVTRQGMLQAEIREIQAKIRAVRQQSGLPEGAMDGECAPKGKTGGCGSCCGGMGR